MDIQQNALCLTQRINLRVWGMGWIACLAMITSANGQWQGSPQGGPTPVPLYEEPSLNTVYSPNGPQSAFGGVPANQAGFGGQGMSLPSRNGMQQPGELQRVQFSQPVGNYGNLELYGSPNDPSQGVGGNFRATPSTWAHFRDLQVGVYTNENQTVIAGGSTMEFYVKDTFGVAGRVLFGGTNNDNIEDEYHFSGDLYGGTTVFGPHWFKAGVLYDVQRNFAKTGPTFGALLFTDHKHPISVDFAYGIGYGDPVLNSATSTVTDVADDDAQLRAGTYLTPNLQCGFSGNWVNFGNDRYEDYNGYGGFVNLNLGTLNINVDMTYGDDRTRGFVNLAYTFGGRRERPRNDCGQPLLVEHPRDWISKPIMRDVSLQLQTQGVTIPPPPAPGFAITQVACNLVLPTRVAAGGDTNLNLIIDAGETFELDVILTNGSTEVANGVALASTASTVIGPASSVGDFGTIQSTVQPGTSVSTDSITDIEVLVNPLATNGDLIFVQFSVDSNGQSRRFQCGPFIVGQTPFTGVPVAATPLN